MKDQENEKVELPASASSASRTDDLSVAQRRVIGEAEAALKAKGATSAAPPPPGAAGGASKPAGTESDPPPPAPPPTQAFGQLAVMVTDKLFEKGFGLGSGFTAEERDYAVPLWEQVKNEHFPIVAKVLEGLGTKGALILLYTEHLTILAIERWLIVPEKSSSSDKADAAKPPS